MYKVKLHIAENYILAFICTFVIVNEFLYFFCRKPKTTFASKTYLKQTSQSLFSQVGFALLLVGHLQNKTGYDQYQE